ncbi:MAG: bifunctional phosphopantothenoylcysteine decarboxylase/phosphopantothenate--cysteine ligase CoaBC [Mariprofundaceae bacterium]|nr:bifunctional phosphopantothenoylcysteine decarboxylase/phosphopantothenate--cysteine ligase CoaBC [Mariprofundaceae bacterium]
MLSGKRILLGISGGIAAYRTAELARLLQKQGAEVRCVMTSGACEFITPLTMEALTGQQVYTELFDLTAEREMGHIRLARWADVLLVAPATADILARFAHGVCDNLLTTLFQARRGPVLLAPAMNAIMWEADATQRNVHQLQQAGVHMIGPAVGDLACGETGPGRMSEPQAVLDAVYPLLTEQVLAGQRWVVNAGPTREAWDGVRVLSNRASGRFGACLAEAAWRRGALVHLIAGPGTPQSSAGINRVDVETAAQMQHACEQAAGGADVFVASAAVGDYRFAEYVSGKLKRSGGGEMQIRMIENDDIVARIAAMPKHPARVIAFAAESEQHIEHGRAKMLAKGADALFANDMSRMGDEQGAGWWLHGDAVIEAEPMDKTELAVWLIERISELGERS